ncbi:Mitogen-activated protein kinase 10 [Acorus calamus]|uniref:Mitogen-activated protein kinase 10 n=1 Tax=Acorus calamus TaxID=4465 RepID=A0AAV9FNK2_ACOCL|nr:Mitogen-activated protein kinase 10 [Acorus calamus]
MTGAAVMMAVRSGYIEFNDTGGPQSIRGRIHSCEEEYFETETGKRYKPQGWLLLLSYTTAIDIWSIGCIFAEVLTGKPLFPGKNVVHQLDLMTDLGTPSLDTVSRVVNEKASRYLSSMKKKQPVPFTQKFPNADPLALKLLERLLAFDPKDRPTAEEALTDPYFKGLAKAEREPSCQSITNAVGQFRKQFAHLEKNGTVVPLERKHVSLPRSTIVHSTAIPPKEQPPTFARFKERQVPDDSCRNSRDMDRWTIDLQRPQATQRIPLAKPGKVVGPVVPYENRTIKEPCDLRSKCKSTPSSPLSLATVVNGGRQRFRRVYQPRSVDVGVNVRSEHLLCAHPFRAKIREHVGDGGDEDLRMPLLLTVVLHLLSFRRPPERPGCGGELVRRIHMVDEISTTLKSNRLLADDKRPVDLGVMGDGRPVEQTMTTCVMDGSTVLLSKIDWRRKS